MTTNLIMLHNRLDSLDTAKAEIITANATITELQEQYTELQTSYNSLITDYSTLEQDYQNLKTSYQELQSNYDELSTSIIGCNSEGPKLNKYAGVNYYNGHKETYYNLPMGQVVANAKNYGLEGEYWIRKDGAKMFGLYVMVAADQSNYPYGSIVETSLGQGIVVDTGAFISTNAHQFDIAVNW